MQIDETSVLQGLEKYFRFKTFHLGQDAVVYSVLSGTPTVAIMPTGAGKSLCYQLPAVLLDGLTIVVSPLIALMKDQVDALNAKGIPAQFLNSSQSLETQNEIIYGISQNRYRLLYIAPERFKHQRFVDLLMKTKIVLFAVDEAHCISRWGHDFRPDYSRLGEIIALVKPERVLACTATATPEIRADIIQSLKLVGPFIHVAGFLRPNLLLEVRRCRGQDDRNEKLKNFLIKQKQIDGAIVIYASTRKQVEQTLQLVSEIFSEQEICAYHGGMGDEQRTMAQNRFTTKQARVVVATNAFGMGVDRNDVRSVIHVNTPRSLDGYYQEVGRAGRDRLPAHCLLLYSQGDAHVHRFLIEQSHPNKEMIEQIWLWLRIEPLGIVDIQKKLDQLKLKQDPELIIKHLSSANVIKYDSQLQKYIAIEAFRKESDISEFQIDTEMINQHRIGEENRLNEMMNFAQHHGCKHGFLLNYFGEQRSRECPKTRLQTEMLKCDHCESKNLLDLSENEGKGCSESEFVMIQKALSGVVRADGRFGLVKVADMLIGSASAEIQKTSLVKLSTYGILKELSKTACKDFLYWLMDMGLIQNQGQEYPTIAITALGSDILFKRVPCQMDFPKGLVERKDRKSKKEDQQSSFKQTQQNMGSFKDLKAATPNKMVTSMPQSSSWRALAQSQSVQKTNASNTPASNTPASNTPALNTPPPNQPASNSWRSFSSPNKQGSAKATHSSTQKPTFQAQNKEDAQDMYSLQAKLHQFALKHSKILGVPIFQILNQETMSQIVQVLPKDQESLIAIKGMGPGKWSRFGQELLTLIKQYVQETSIFSSQDDSNLGEASYQESSYQESSYQESSYQESSYQEPSYQEPSYQEPSYQAQSIFQEQQAQLRLKLKEFRLLKSKEDHVPAYVVFHDSVIEQLVQHRPRTKEEFLKIQGLGPAKWAKYGPTILEIIQIEF